MFSLHTQVMDFSTARASSIIAKSMDVLVEIVYIKIVIYHVEIAALSGYGCKITASLCNTMYATELLLKYEYLYGSNL